MSLTRKKAIVKHEGKNVLLLPSDNKKMELFIKDNKVKLMECAISSIEFGLQNNLPFVEVYTFNDSNFVITISEKDYLVNVNHIYNFYLESENYELCPRVVRLQSLLKKINDEKEIELNGEG